MPLTAIVILRCASPHWSADLWAQNCLNTSYAPLHAQKWGVHWLASEIGQQPVLSASMHARLHARSEAPNSVQRQLYKNHQEDRQKTSPFDTPPCRARGRARHLSKRASAPPWLPVVFPQCGPMGLAPRARAACAAQLRAWSRIRGLAHSLSKFVTNNNRQL